ncbi:MULTISPECIES: BTAD domain-containing putative transcriptional regulator [unclassified Streptomyces]|uniref:AfsR/SARP family transcriptional regulator n=1 Tax=unclassified Streptomyces TaxID=2593676 RepID=UPI00225A2C50|nr:BTAD domain-containing putative transcriptional regulator [Streptomyces sp. NBC_00338]MCX5141825.1 winged helix-turn-helix domain-containing protein [Streptomyces sp. NBC_00338]
MEVPSSSVEARFLGAFDFSVDGVPVERWRAGKSRSLFQYLLIHRNQLMVTDRLHEVLWPDQDGGSSSLKVAVHALRQILAQPPASRRQMRVVYRDFGYLLQVGDIRLDVDELERWAESGRAAEARSDVREADHCYEQAVALYRGDFLVGESADWAVEQRQWCRAIVLRVLERLTLHAARRNDYAEVLHWCRRTLAIEPYCESAYQALITSHGRLGELESARNWHRICVRRLRDDLGIQATRHTHEIFSQAMRGQLRAVG